MIFIAVIAALMAILMICIVGVLISAIVMMVLGVVKYVATSLVRVKILKLFGTCNPVLGWIPIVGDYYVGMTCTGKDGQNTGIFGWSIPNFLFQFGWLSSLAVSFGDAWYAYNNTTNLQRTLIFASFWFLQFLWLASVCTFVLSRAQGVAEDRVTVSAVFSAMFLIVRVLLILSIRVPNVFSRDNDIYPLESTPDYDKHDQGYSKRNQSWY